MEAAERLFFERGFLQLHRHSDYDGFLRMLMVDSRQFPWIADSFDAVIDPQTGRGLGRESLPVSEAESIDETIHMFGLHYRGPRFAGRAHDREG
ncbi:hypothetical protein [Rhodoblastus sp.]|uniref:hypothetical protein n=1 Tax=Rhodoblastus sp. TaxID=1962975 RepID=UPI003F9704D6